MAGGVARVVAFGTSAAAVVSAPYDGEDKSAAAPAGSGTPSASVAEPAVKPGAGVVSERPAYTRSFAMSTPGELVTRVYQAPVHYRSGEENFL